MTNQVKTRAKRVKMPEPSEAGAKTIVYQDGLLPSVPQEAPEKPAKGKAAQVAQSAKALEKKRSAERAVEVPVPTNDETPEVTAAREFISKIPSIAEVKKNATQVSLKDFFKKDKAEDGQWFPLGTGRIKVAPLANETYERRIQEALSYKEYEAFQKGEYDYFHESGRCANAREIAELVAGFYVGTVFLDAEDLELEDGPWEFNQENATELMMNEQFQQFIVVCASALMKEKLENDEAATKN